MSDRDSISVRLSCKRVSFIIKFTIAFLNIYKAGSIKPRIDHSCTRARLGLKSLFSSIKFNNKYKEELFNGNNSIDEKIDEFTPEKVFYEYDAELASQKNRKLGWSKENLKCIHWLARPYHVASLIFNLYLLIKYGILCALDTGILSDYYYLDCIIPGRIILDGRAVLLTRHAVLMISISQVSWAMRMFFNKDRYNLEPFEFLCLEDEQDFERLNEKSIGSRQAMTLFHHLREQSLPGKSYLTTTTSCNINSLGQKTNRTSASNGCGLIPAKWKAPTRSKEAWLYMSRHLYPFLITVTILYIISVSLVSLSQVSLYFSRRGFEVTHERCVKWSANSLAKEEQFGSQSLDFIQNIVFNYIYKPRSSKFFVTKQMRGIQVEFDEFIDFNCFHIIRVVITLLETLLFSIGFSYILAAGVILIYISVNEIRFYIDFQSKELDSLIQTLRLFNIRDGIFSSFLSPEMKAHYEHSKVFLAGKKLDSHNVWVKTYHTQTMILDMFRTLKSNNIFVRDLTLWYSFIWFYFSALTTIWSILSSDFVASSRLECYLIHLFATFLCVLVIGITADVSRESRLLHRKIVTCMALDNQNLDLKSRWMGILRYYFPIPLHCFTAATRSEMSWSFALKLLTWLFSSIFVASTFYTYYH